MTLEEKIMASHMAASKVPYARYIRCERTAQDDVLLGTVRRLNRIWPVKYVLEVIEEEMDKRHIVPGPGGNCEGSWRRVADGLCQNGKTYIDLLTQEFWAFTDDELVSFYCAAVTYLYDIPVRKQSVAGIVPRPAYVATSDASSSDEGFSLWPLKLILGIAAVAIGIPLIGVLAQMGGFFIVILIMMAGMSAVMRDIF